MASGDLVREWAKQQFIHGTAIYIQAHEFNKKSRKWKGDDDDDDVAELATSFI